MAIINLKGNGQLRTGRTELDVPHLGKILTSVLPLIGPNYHANVMGEIDKQSQSRPTTAQTISLVDLALQNQDVAHCIEVVQKFKNNYLWSATEGTSFSEGYLAYDNIDGKMPSDSESLVRMFSEKDSRVRLVKPDFKIGYFPLKDFLKHPVLVAHVGEEMIPTVERVAKTLNKSGGYVYVVNNSKSDDKRLTAICSDRGGGRLGLDGYCSGDSDGGCASGVLK
ncbi:MAG: hypothetical protein AABX73_02605 [Nanoarchaeota archaeon]